MNVTMTHALASLPRSGRCQAQSTRTYVRCENSSPNGGRFCRLHQNQALAVRTPGRAATRKTGGYLRHLTPTGQEMFRESLGDLSVLEELAMVRSVLADILERRRDTLDLEEFLMTVPYGGGLGQEANGDFAPVPSEQEQAAERIRRNRKANNDDLEVIGAAEKLIRMASNAHEMLAGKRVQVSFQDATVEEEVRKNIEAFSKELFSWLPHLLCGPCRDKLSEELLSAQRTVIVSE